MRGLTVACMVAAVLAGANASAQGNRCAECHFANFPDVPAGHLLARWDQSAHAKHGVGCERCHGGDPTTYQPLDAHRGVLNSRQPLSSVNRANLALTCAACHAGVAASFKVSGHAERMATNRTPDCTTCHGVMAAQVPSAARLETTCRGCHGGDSARADYPGLARSRVDAVHAIELTLTRLETTIASVDDRQKRNRLAAELLLARAALRNAVDALHTFDFRTMDEQRAIAQRRTSELVSMLIR